MTGYCRRCGKKARGKMQIANAERYAPFCSYQCQQYWNLDEAREYLAAIGVARSGMGIGTIGGQTQKGITLRRRGIRELLKGATSAMTSKTEIIYPTRCEIIDVTGMEVIKGFLGVTPEKSKPFVGQRGTAELEADGNVRVTLDSGDVLMGWQCWWTPVED